MKLSIVIPALNEEASIEQVICNTLAARNYIVKNSSVSDVELTVVSDGSTDRTVELANKYADRIRVIVFEKNRGYGAAIKEGWRQSEGDLLGFMDADGTCDPKFFADLCTIMEEQKADLALGARINKSSKMPLIRRLGNRIFAMLVSFMSHSKVMDVASGMRVVRRSCLHKLMPLPDGLHFTPSMSARANLSDDIKLVEKQMPYNERSGKSKLKVFRDGLRFLSVIIKTALLYRPNFFLSTGGLFFLLVAIVIGMEPGLYYLTHHSLLDWMIYRFLVAQLSVSLSTLFFCSAYLTEKMVIISLFKNMSTRFGRNILTRFFNSKTLWVTVITLIVAGIALVFNSLLERLLHGTTNEHWSRYITMSTLYAIAFSILFTKVIDHTLNLIAQRKNFLDSPDPFNTPVPHE